MSFLTQLWVKIKSLISRDTYNNQLRENKPLRGDIFHIYEGIHRNKFIIFVDEIRDKYNFLIFPDASNITISKPDFKMGNDKNIITFIENTPGDVYGICNKQFKYNENSYNRR